jgi:subtilisin family serine protease
MRVRLPGSGGSRSTYYFRVRSAGNDIDAANAGLSAGAYQVQVRLREAQEWAGSTVNYADIRYSTNGVHLRGMPGESPLIGEAGEDESVGTGQFTANNGVATGNGRQGGFGSFFGNPNFADAEIGNRPQYIGNILNTAKGAISVAGTISAANDLDFYMLEVNQENLVGGIGNGFAPVVFDIDYADGLNRPDISINVFRQEPSNNPFEEFQYRLVFTGNSSNIIEDQPRPLAGTDMQDLSRGSAGTRDGFIGPVALQEGIYLVAISSAALQPRAVLLNPSEVQPINSIRRIVDERFQPGVTTAEPPVVVDFLPRTDIGATGELVSATFDLGGYSTADQANVYVDYAHPGGTFQLFVRNSAGVETLVATSAFNPNIPDLPVGSRSAKIPLSFRNWDFAGQDGLQLVFRSTNPLTEIDNVIIGFAERGEQVTVGSEPSLLLNAFMGQLQVRSTREFSLETYLAGRENPALSFNYEILNGDLDVFVVPAVGFPTRIATSVAGELGATEVLLVAGAPETALISLNRWADDPGLRVEFRTRDADPTNVLIQHVHILLSDGARVGTGETNSTFAPVPVPSTTVTTGNYQLEVRLGDTFFESQAFGAPVLTQSFDTNDRLADVVSLVAPAGADITAGDKFEISDGGTVVVFEFTQTGAVGLGNIAVRFSPTDTNFEVARRIRDAINNPTVQSRLRVRSATSSGIVSGTLGRDPKLSLFGNATVKTIQAANAAGEVEVIYHTGRSDSNVPRDQGQVLIQNSFIRQARDYSIWSEPAARLQDPRDQLSFIEELFMQAKPGVVGTQAVRNLLVPNDSVQGGLLPGVVIQNNVLEEGGLGGINISGESPIWMISPALIPFTDDDPTENNTGTHFGFYIDDGDQLVIDSDRTRLRFEFEDLAGGATGGPVFGSGTVEGNGYGLETTIAWYRDQGGAFYQRLQGGDLQPFATNAFETMHALRDSILGSILVTNGTTQQVRATIAESLMGPDPGGPANTQFGLLSYPEYFNRPAVYLEGVTNIQYLNSIGGGNPFDIRTLALGVAPQPHARIINNTIIGQDGRASFNGESALSEPNDTLADAVQTWQGSGQKPLVYSDIGFIGDGGQAIAGSTASNQPNSSGGGSGNPGGGGVAPNSFVQGRAIVRFEDGVSIAEQEQLLAARGLEVVRRFNTLNAVTVQLQPQHNVINITNDLNALPQVRYSEPDFIVERLRTPNDPRYVQQWALNNTGQTGGTPGADINAPEAWNTTVGSSEVVVAIIDSGIDYNHPDLAANMWINPGEIPGNGIDDDGNGYIDDVFGIDTAEGDSDPMDIDGHGTHVAGTVAAVGNNGRGVTGVSWNTKLMALKIFDGPFGGSVTAVVGAIEYMTMMRTQYGINIVASNNSYGGYGFSQATSDAVAASIDAGILFVAAAGNDTNNNDVTPAFPASLTHDGIISVSATDHNDRIANFSNFGLTSVDVGAPGVDILSTLPGGGYGLLSGTSMASPHVAGVAALLASARPNATVNQLKAAILLGADPIDSLDDTTVTGARLNATTALRAIGAGLGDQLSNTDVDIYQFKLGTGERAFIDILTQNSGLNAALQIFDSQGTPQTFLNARGEPVTLTGTEAGMEGLEPSADFTALRPGVYFAAVSSVGNTTYDPLSQANRTPGNSTGAYRISISARTLNEFVITAQDASAYAAGETFTIHGISDSDVSGSTGVTFEFVIGIGDPLNPTHIPINIAPDWRYPDVARAIAKAINEGDFGRPAIANAQQLPNGRFGTASPLPPVHAQALGGITGVIDAPLTNMVGDLADVLVQFAAVDELGTNAVSAREIERQISGPFHQVNQGLQLFPRRGDGGLTSTTTTISTPRHGTFTHTQIASLSNYGIGHDRVSTTPLSPTSLGNGASEKFVVIRNAAMIDGNGVVRVSPDLDTNNNLDQLIPETGILATRGASPTILNNVFFNVQTPIVNEESRRFPLTGGPAPYGTNNPNFVIKPGEVIVGGSIYQFHETAGSTTRFGTGIETSPTNVPNTALDFNVSVPATTRLFVNAQAGQYLPAAGSPLIDSSIDSLPERPGLAAVKTAMGLAVSPVLAPSFDLAGQLRADDPSVAPPSGQGQNVFKDRGAFERADFIGPAAVLLNPIDNDALGIDIDPSDSVVQLTSGVYPEFRIQLKDGNEPSNPLLGLGINDDTVVSSTGSGSDIRGTSVVLFENGRMLVEGIDYRFAYNATRDEIILTPLAGVWKNGAAYEITINNRDRFVIDAPAGDEVSDGDSFTIVDANGGVVHFEFDSGYQIQIPQGLTLQIPLAGASFGGIVDGERFSIATSSGRTTFEFDRNGNVLDGNRPIPFVEGASQGALVNAVIAAIGASGIAVTPRDLGEGRLFLAAESGVRLDTTFTVADQPTTALGIAIPDEGLRVVFDGDLFTVSDGRETRRFEMDLDGNVGIGNIAVDYSTALTKRDLAAAIQLAIQNSGLNLTPEIIGEDVVFLGLSVNGSATINSSRLAVVGVARTLGDGQSFSITHVGVTETFEFTRDATVAAGNIPVQVSILDTQNEIGQRLVTAIRDSGLGLNPLLVGEGNIALRGTAATSVDVTGAPDLVLSGTPGVQSSTTLSLSGPLLVQARGAADIVDGSTFTVRGNGRTVAFEFDINGSGPSQPGNVIVAYTALSSANDIALAIAAAIRGADLGLDPTVLGGGLLQLGHVPTDTVNVRNSGLVVSQGLVGDGEFFTISNGTRTVTFEFDDAGLNNGSTLGRVPILYSGTSTVATIIQTMQAAINGAGLGLETTISGEVLSLNDRPTYTIDVTGAPTLVKTGVPGGATPVFFFADSSFTSTDMKQAIVDAINAALNTNLEASNRGGSTLYVSGAITISSELESFFLRGVADLAGNFLKANRVNGETQFTILMPGVELDFGDAPDPFNATLGRYPTLFVNDGARHVVGTTALLGSGISADRDGQPSPNADSDLFDDGVVFGSLLATPGVFNRDALTPVTVTMSSPGFVDAWIDFNGDGDWDDPGEKILNSVRFTDDSLTQTFMISVPATAPIPPGPIQAAARFRSSTVGGLQATGLAVDGEVEDYMVTIVPGTPPVAVDDAYTMNEDTTLVTNDPTGNLTPGFTIDDGIAANDSTTSTSPLSVTLVTPPQHAANFELQSDGTFLYRPLPNFFGTDTFTYRVNDGVLGSNNIGTVTITVNEVNDPPIAADDAFEIDEDEVLDLPASALLANDVAGPDNESNQTLTITGVSQVSAQGGSVALVDGRVVYTPQENFSGIDTFTYTITDNGTTAGLAAPLSSTATVTVTVLDKNDPPITGGDSMTAVEDTPATITTATLLANDLPGPPAEVAAGQTLTFVRVLPTSTNGGTVTESGGVVTYTPPADFVGTDTFFYEVVDDGLSGGVPDPQTSVGTVTVTVSNVNDAPRVSQPFGTVETAEDSAATVLDLSEYFFDPDVVTSGDILTYTLVSNSNATLVAPTITGGQLVLELLADQNGQSIVVVRATDLAGLSVENTLTLVVTPVNDAPRLVQALPDLTVEEDAVIPGIVLSPTYFFDPDVILNGDVLTFQVVSNSNPLLVTPTISGNTLNLSLVADQSGSSLITISATDSSGQTISDQFNLIVTPVNDPPITVADSYTVPQGTELTTTDPRGLVGGPEDDGVLANDRDPEGATLTAILVDGPQHASSFTLNPNGTFTYRHNGLSRQTDSFTYRAFDGSVSSAVTTVTITISDPPPPPHQNPINHSDVNADGFVSPIDVLLIVNFINANGNGVSVSTLPPPPPFRDVDGDNRITPNDILRVINTINQLRGGGEGEGASFLGGSIDVSAGVTDSLGTELFGADMGAPEIVSRTAGNTRIGMRDMQITDALYGPVQPALQAVLMELEQANLTRSMADLSWLMDEPTEEAETPIDLALASLLGDVDEGEL